MHKLLDINEEAKQGYCLACEKIVPLFYRKDRKRWQCLVKRRADLKKRKPTYSKDNPKPKYYYPYDRFKQHGITEEDYAALLVSQNYTCALCHKPYEKLHIDHDHVTGRIRGLLCISCNTALGRLGDSTESILAVLNYIS